MDNKRKWRLRATKLGRTDLFQVRVFQDIHSCSSDMVNHGRHASNWVLIHWIQSKFERAGRRYLPNEIRLDVQSKFGININYDKAWRARENAVDSSRRSQEESFAKLSSYCALLESNNCGTVIHI